MDRSQENLPEAEAPEEAVSWFLRIRDGFSQTDFREWRRWLAEDDANAGAFDAVREFWQAADQVDDLPWPGDEELEFDTYDGQSALPVPGKEIRGKERGRGNRWVWLAAAASIVALGLIGLGLLHGNVQDSVNYETMTAEHRLILLEDGSSVTLGAESELRIVYDRRARRVELRRGQAYFKVAKDPSRPFIVAAGSRTVRALGTEFDVSIGVRDIKVSVTEGHVRVEGPPRSVSTAGGNKQSGGTLNLEKGDVLDFNAAGSIGIVNQTDPMLSTSWLTGRLAYDGASLESVIADVNRYSEVELMIGDDDTKQLKITATFFSDDIDNWLAALEQAFPLQVVHVEGLGIIIVQAER